MAGTIDKVLHTEPQKIITVRLGKSLHEALLAAARARGVSLNLLCLRLLAEPLGRSIEYRRSSVDAPRSEDRGTRDEGCPPHVQQQADGEVRKP